MRNEGYIYVARCDLHKDNTYKIGMTCRSVEERMRELSQFSGVPVPFRAVHSVRVIDCVLAEELLHEKLDVFRLQPNREFFDLPLARAKLAVDSIAKHINALADIELDLGTTDKSRPAANESTWGVDVSNWSKKHFEPKPKGDYVSTRAIRVDCPKCRASYVVTLSRYETGATCLSCGAHTAQDVNW